MVFIRLQGCKVNVCNVWGWHHPAWESVVDMDEHKGLRLIFASSLFYFSDCFTAKKPPRSVYHIGASEVWRSVWEAFMCKIQFKIPSLSVKLCFISFPLAPDVIWIPYVKLFCICYAHRGDNLYALLPDCSIIHFSPHWLLNMKHASSIKPLLSPGQWSGAGEPRVFSGLVKRQTLWS